MIRNLKNIVSNSFLTVTKTTMDALVAGCIKDSLTFLNMEFLKRRITSSSTRVQVVAKLRKRSEIKRDTCGILATWSMMVGQTLNLETF